jgi:hypothetical protein
MEQNSDRRKFERIFFSKQDEVMVSLVIPDYSEKPIAVQVLNIAMGGIFFTVRSIRKINLQIGQTVIFKEIYDNSNHVFPLDANAKIIWIMDDDSQEYTGVGSKFIESEEENLQEKLTDYLEQLQKE